MDGFEGAYPVTSGAKSMAQDRKVPSCNACRRRKIKCDRADPCSYCVRTGVDCMWSAPSGVPRGRQGGRRRKVDSELFARVQKLENLIKNIEGGRDDAVARAGLEVLDKPKTGTTKLKHGHKAAKESSSRYLGGSLWMDLSDEIHGMREVLYQSSEDEDTHVEESPSLSELSLVKENFVIFDPNVFDNAQNPLRHLSPRQVDFLYSSFMVNVEPAVKILHDPSLRRFLIGGTEGLDCSPGPNGWGALKFAIYYITATSLTPEECLHHLGDERLNLLQSFRSNTELALARADIVNTEEMSTLQALVLYLLAVRSNENSRRTWTLVSLAIRIAQALGLHREPVSGDTSSQHHPFEQEMRRRLWWQICVIDRQASSDRGSDPIITSGSFNTLLPLHINDRDISPNDLHDVQPRQEFSDTTLTLVCHEVFDVERRLNYLPAGEPDQEVEGTEDPWAQRRAWVAACQERIAYKYLRYCSMNVPLQRYTKLVADIMIATLWLWTYRPLQKHPNSPSPVNTPYPGILQLSVEVLEKALRVTMDPFLQPFRWITSIWVQWHALAITIAELCVQTTEPIVTRAWIIVDTVYEEMAQRIADSVKGRLWRPIEKLMAKARMIQKRPPPNAITFSDSGGSDLFTQRIQWPANQLLDHDSIQPEVGYGLQSTTSGLLPQLNHHESSSEARLVNHESWGDQVPFGQTDYNNDMSQMAWTDWETFIDDYEAHNVYQGNEIRSTFNL